MKKLKQPTKELASRILGEFNFEQRIVGYCLKNNKGFMQIPMYSFEEVVGFLNTPIPYIEIDELEGWIREVMDDKELADIIRRQNEQDMPEMAKIFFIRDLMVQRLIQCKEV